MQVPKKFITAKFKKEKSMVSDECAIGTQECMRVNSMLDFSMDMADLYLIIMYTMKANGKLARNTELVKMCIFQVTRKLPSGIMIHSCVLLLKTTKPQNQLCPIDL
jgi:hypothetical protein